jgi:ubiquinone/menaquinone biosynthesis methyltransferase
MTAQVSGMSSPIADVASRAGHEHEHGDAVRAMFDRIAPTYDLLNRAMSAGLDARWRKRAIARLEGLPTGPILDLCAGTLDLAAALEGAYPERTIVAADFAADMLERGKHKVRRTERVVADALALPFETGQFAAVINGFGLRNLAATEAGVVEAKRVLAPGGRLVFLEFFRPDHGALAAVTKGFHAVFARAVLPMAGAIVAKDRHAYAYLARSMATFLSRTELETMLTRQGFRDVRGEDLTLGVASIVSATRSAELS